MTELDIQRLLIRDRFRRAIVCPNYTPTGWFECDVFELTRSGYFREYEIKLTRQDFESDAGKMKSKRTDVMDADRRFIHETRVKHDELAAHSVCGPSQFWFVSPEGILYYEDMPVWAGLLIVNSQKVITMIKKAPRLHGEKADVRIEPHVRGIFYWRFQNLFLYAQRISPANVCY